MKHISMALVETFEQRRLLSYSISDDTLTILGSSVDETVRIVDAAGEEGPRVSYDANGDGDFADAADLNAVVLSGVENFTIWLRGGDDTLSFRMDLASSVQRTLFAHLGQGDNHFDYGFGLSQGITHSLYDVVVRAGHGNDTASIGLGNFRFSQLEFAFDLGPGADVLSTNFFGDPQGASASVAANLGSGRDEYRGTFSYDSYDPLGSVALDVDGGPGSDGLELRVGPADEAQFSSGGGGFSADLRGGPGDDRVEVAMTTPASFGTIAVRAAGGAGQDLLDLRAGVYPHNTGGQLDFQLLGGAGDDVLYAYVSDPSGNIGYAGSGAVLIDGGGGNDACTTLGDAPYLVKRCP